MAIPLNLDFPFFKKNWGNSARLWSALKEQKDLNKIGYLFEPWFPIFQKKLGQLCSFMVSSQRAEILKRKLPLILGAIPLPIWSLTCHHHMFVYQLILTHMHQNVRIDCSNNFVSSVKICEYFFQNESSKCNQCIQWFYKNIWFKKRSKIANQNPQALRKISCESKFHASA